VNTAVSIPPDIEKILDLARWAPSGDNTQVWRFEIIDENRFVVHGHDTRDWCVYDLEGRASQIALGALVENIVLAAANYGYDAEISAGDTTSDTAPKFVVELREDRSIDRDPLVEWIPQRVTQRRPLKTTPLSAQMKATLEQSVGADYSLTWIEGASERWKMARLLFDSAKIRLTIPEAYEVHRRIIEWDAVESADRIPDKAVGMDPAGLKLMRLAMQSWRRVDTLNRYFAGTLLPRLQLDLLPGFRCGAHFLLKATKPLKNLDDYIAGGRAMQRLWLQATELGLQFQPEMTPLIFAGYAANDVRFTSVDRARRAADDIRRRLPADAVEHGVFMGRMGFGNMPTGRSVRLELKKLMRTDNSIESDAT
jgi:hypothetical protein